MRCRVSFLGISAVLSLLAGLLLSFQSARADVTEAVLDKARKELVARLEKTQPELAKYFEGVDAATWGRYAGEIANGNAQAVFDEALAAKKQEVLDDLYEKGKEYAIAKGVLGGDTGTYIGWAEEHGADALAMAEKAYAGDFRGAGDIVLGKIKEKVGAAAKGKAADAIDFFLKDVVGHSVGAIYLKIIELEIEWIEWFRLYTVEDFGTFTITLDDGSKAERNWCVVYRLLRGRGHSSHDAFYRQLSDSGLPLPLADATTLPGKWYSTQQANAQRPSLEEFREQLESCYGSERLKNLEALKKHVDNARAAADVRLFGPIQEGMKERKRQIVDIIEQTKIPDVTVVVTAFDKDTGTNVAGASIAFDGEKKVAAAGVASFVRTGARFSAAAGAGTSISAEAKGYEPKTVAFSAGEVAQSFSAEKAEVQLKVSLTSEGGLPADVRVDVTVTDQKSGDKIAAAKATFDGETKDAPGGVASFTRKGAAFAADKSGAAFVLAAEAPDHKPGGATFTASELAGKYDKNAKKIDLAIALEPQDVKEIDALAVRCDRSEILETEASVCTATLSYKSGPSKDVSTAVKWTPAFVDATKGTVKGREAKAGSALPVTVTAEATYQAPPEEGGKPWVAADTVTVKPEPPKGPGGIRVTKAADKQTVKPGETVTYTYALSGTGGGPITDVDISDNKCSPLKPKAGDANGDAALDANETWIYECSANLNGDTTNTVTAEGKDGSGKVVTATASVTVKVPGGTAGQGPCPPPKVLVPGVIGQAEADAKGALKKKPLTGVVLQRDHSETVALGIVMDQDPPEGTCVGPNSVVNLWVSAGPKPQGPPPTPGAGLAAKIDCGPSFEIAAGDFLGKSCTITVTGWRGNTTDPVKVQLAYDKKSGIDVFPGDWSAAGDTIYRAGIQDHPEEYNLSEHFTAKDNARQGTTQVTITVSQAVAGSVTLTLDIAVLPKGALTSTGPGIRPPAAVATGSGGQFCVWRYKLFGDPPPCFHFAKAVCGKYGPPDYELVGAGMTWEEAGHRMAQLSSYFDDKYGCNAYGSGAAGGPDDCPDDPKKTAPGTCGCGVPDDDTDGDGVPDCKDGCPNDPDKTAPIGCGCDKPDVDTDKDGFLDCHDECPTDPDKHQQGECGCFATETDTDADGTLDCNDHCPKDPNKVDPGECGCGNPETDTDGDGTADCADDCPQDPEKVEPGYCGCGKPETDADNDEVPDCADQCPKDPEKSAPGVCGCGTADTDTDGDEAPDCRDRCPNDPNKTEPGRNGCGVAEASAPRDDGSPFDDNYNQFTQGHQQHEGQRPLPPPPDPHGPKGSGYTSGELGQELGQTITNMGTQGGPGPGGGPGTGQAPGGGPGTGQPPGQGPGTPPGSTPPGPMPPQKECDKKHPCDKGLACVDGKCVKKPPPAAECKGKKDCPPGQECVRGKCQKVKGAKPQKVKCDALTQAGGNRPERFTVQLGDAAGTVRFDYNMFYVPDQMIVNYAGKQVVSTGCVGDQHGSGRGSGSATFKTNGKNTTATVIVTPSCQGGDTQWNFTMHCP